jgi:hypothetical protein
MSGQAVHGAHEYADDPRNDDVLIHVNGELTRRQRRWCRCSTRASCSATGCGKVGHRGASASQRNQAPGRQPA